ncbi:putative two-component system sensor histidine kinase [Oceaniovalibus guishaninsula JLT2003]|uniref:Putative two-component system sensor histidine kinase n=1 Tax=Oceaniovalibus guishaninsula JLT2003 TaxID=1231392 RepID=K2HKM5_9RHOB|nr:histidine kinase dimerization/phosphoacceptor domain -containing protein [Oceaniovalibus guishaninsula]EKE43484.1 putative two-component system sensor histidine kinase [Oceaniovalibus guishaninsula JLT2003]
MRAPAHPRQDDRLIALASYEILDTDREAEFDEVVDLTARICDAPISVVNLIDAGRQWFKAETGLGVRETPLDSSLCSHAILEHDFVEIEDTLADPRMADNPLCLGDRGLRFYAGALLRSDQGLPIGTLCVLDYRPRRLTDLQRDTMRILAGQVMARLDLRRALAHADMLRKEVDHRVKNSLTSLASLARIQGRVSVQAETREAMQTMENRIRAVSMLHEQLYRTDAGSRVDLGSYVANLCGYLDSIRPANVTLSHDAVPIRVSSQEAAAVGTLVNEFVSNALKHAFPNNRPGHVSVRVTVAADGRVGIFCADDGIGMQRQPAAKPGLGMQVAEAICTQLGCDLSVAPNASGGVTASLSFRPEGAGDAQDAERPPERQAGAA